MQRANDKIYDAPDAMKHAIIGPGNAPVSNQALESISTATITIANNIEN